MAKRRVPKWVIALSVIGVLGVCLPCAMTRIVFRAWKQEGSSMEPSLPSGARFFASTGGEPARGDVVVFESPEGGDVVKRAIALAGDTVEIREGRVIVNGDEITREVIGPALPDDGELQCLGEVLGAYHWLAIDSRETPASQPALTVPPNHVYVLGDNRTRSLDSRELGPIPLGDIHGVLAWLYHPGEVEAGHQCPQQAR
jgi:signal peptidase I